MTWPVFEAVVDAGGSRIRAQLHRHGELVADSQLDVGANPNLVGRDLALQRLSAVISNLLADLVPGTFCPLALGMAGAGDANQRRQFAEDLNHLMATKRLVHVVGDGEAMVAAAVESGPVIALLVGTGAVVWARNKAGESRNFGGFLPSGGDPGSGHWLGLQASRRISPRLTCSSAEELESLAVAGNEEACKLLSEAAQELLKLVEAAISFVVGANPVPAPTPIPFVCHGGVIENAIFLRRVLNRGLAPLRSELIAVESWRPPIWGALRLARRQSFWRTPSP